MHPGSRTPRIALTLATLSLVITGCTAAPDPGASPEPTTASPSETAPTTSSPAVPTPEPEEPTAAVPATCEELLSTEAISDALEEAWYDSGEPVDPASELPGPSAREAAESAEISLSCRWWPEMASEGYLLGYAFELDGSTRDGLIDALGSASTCEEITLAGADAGFLTSELRGDLRHNTVYAFVDDVWIALIAPLFEERLVGFAEDAIAGIAV